MNEQYIRLMDLPYVMHMSRRTIKRVIDTTPPVNDERIVFGRKMFVEKNYMLNAFKKYFGANFNSFLENAFETITVIPKDEVMFYAGNKPSGVDSKATNSSPIPDIPEEEKTAQGENLEGSEATVNDETAENEKTAVALAGEVVEEYYTKRVQELEDELEAMTKRYMEAKERHADVEKAVHFFELLAGSDDDITMRAMASIITQTGFTIKSTQLFEFMRKVGYLYDNDETHERNIPTIAGINSGIFRIREVLIQATGGKVHISFTPKIKADGQAKIIDIFMRLMEKGYNDYAFITDSVIKEVMEERAGGEHDA